jgi:hypothetical protein
MQCPNCHHEALKLDRFCRECGSLQGESRTVTTLAASVAHYTGLYEKLDPEEVRRIMDGCFKILIEEIHIHEGAITLFTGDGVMALFGAPGVNENHAQMACHAALAVYGDQVQKDTGIHFQMRIGINSGAAVIIAIGDDLRTDYTAMGETGEAGVGKSRLLLEMRNRLPENEHTVLEGKCPQYGGTVLYKPILDILKSLFEIKDNDREDILKEKIRDKISGWGKGLGHALPAVQDLLLISKESGKEAFSRSRFPCQKHRGFGGSDLTHTEDDVLQGITAADNAGQPVIPGPPIASRDVLYSSCDDIRCKIRIQEGIFPEGLGQFLFPLEEGGTVLRLRAKIPHFQFSDLLFMGRDVGFEPPWTFLKVRSFYLFVVNHDA